MKFGIIGYGRFGKLWAESLTAFGEVFVYDPNITHIENHKIKLVSLKEVCDVDIIFLLVPIALFEASCQEIKPFLRKDTIVVDGCSVKVFPVEIMEKIFEKQQPLIATHPLFGPDSVSRSGGLGGHKIVVCYLNGTKQQNNVLTNLLRDLQLTIIESTPDEHDKQMATSQSLVHFIGRALAALDLKEQKLATPDFQALLHIDHMVVHDSWQLFLDMHRYNPYAKSVREDFIHQLIKLDSQISDSDM